MQLSVVALAAFAATAAAWSNGTVYTTEVLTAYTTVCPAATSFSVNGVTYTVTEVRNPQPRYGSTRFCERGIQIV
jgi:hypothetical protein